MHRSEKRCAQRGAYSLRPPQCSTVTCVGMCAGLQELTSCSSCGVRKPCHSVSGLCERARSLLLLRAWMRLPCPASSSSYLDEPELAQGLPLALICLPDKALHGSPKDMSLKRCTAQFSFHKQVI